MTQQTAAISSLLPLVLQLQLRLQQSERPGLSICEVLHILVFSAIFLMAISLSLYFFDGHLSLSLSLSLSANI